MALKCPIARKAYDLSKMKNCLDCGKLCGDRSAIRCKICSNKFRSFRTKGKCLDCSVQLKGFHASRCLKCHNIKQNQGKSRERTLFNVSKAWQKVRTTAYERDDYTCQCCGKRGGYLHGHHFLLYSEYPELRLDLNNIVTVCKPCHKYIHFGKEF